MSHVTMANLGLDLKGVQTSDTFFGTFKNGGSDDLKVNGSITPVEFTLEDMPVHDFFLLQRISLLIGADTVMDLNDFGNLAALTNGVEFAANINTPAITVSTHVKTNGDALLAASDAIIAATSFAATDKTIIRATWDFPSSYGGHAPIVVDNDLKIIINDDLLLMEYFRISCHGILLDKGGV